MRLRSIYSWDKSGVFVKIRYLSDDIGDPLSNILSRERITIRMIKTDGLASISQDVLADVQSDKNAIIEMFNSLIIFRIE